MDFNVEAFLAESPFKPDAVLKGAGPHYSGLPQRQGGSSPGFNLTVSQAGFDDLAGQIIEAVAFLDEFEDELRRLARFPGVEAVSLDFAVRWRDVAAQTDTFPPELLWRSGALDIAIAISHYPVSDKGS